MLLFKDSPHQRTFLFGIIAIGFTLKPCYSFLPPARIANYAKQRHRSTVRVLMASARQLIGQGMQSFRDGDVEGSIRYFDQAEVTEPSMTPFLWQRGLSYYYADQFDAASKQFRTDVQVNPADAEEIVWDIASQLRLRPDSFPVPNQLALPRKDPRRIMVCLTRKGATHRIAPHLTFFLITSHLFTDSFAARERKQSWLPQDMLARKYYTRYGCAQELFVSAYPSNHCHSTADMFYADFYLALYSECRGETTKAAAYIQQALKTPYASASNDYMVACARVHAKIRGWE